MRKDKMVPLAELISVMNHPDCPGELYNALSDAILDLDSGQGEKVTAAWIQFKLDRYKEAEEKGY